MLQSSRSPLGCQVCRDNNLACVMVLQAAKVTFMPDKQFSRVLCAQTMTPRWYSNQHGLAPKHINYTLMYITCLQRPSLMLARSQPGAIDSDSGADVVSSAGMPAQAATA